MIGGGNTAVEEALFLTNFASEVTVVHRRDEFRAERILQNRLFAHPKIKVIWDTVLDDVVGTDDPKGVTGARLKNVKTGASAGGGGRRHLHRHRPQAGDRTVRGSAAHQGRAAISSPNRARPQPPFEGVYAAGDVTDDIYRQAVTAAGLGCMAALEAEKWLHAREQVREAAE